MYENENKNMNGLGNENMEHRDVPETTVNWTIPGDGEEPAGDRIRRTSDNGAGGTQPGRRRISIHRISIHRPRKARVPVSSIEEACPGTRCAFGSYSSQTRRQDFYGGNTYQGYPGGGDKQRNHSNKGRFVKERQELQRQQSFSGRIRRSHDSVNYLGTDLQARMEPRAR